MRHERLSYERVALYMVADAEFRFVASMPLRPSAHVRPLVTTCHLFGYARRYYDDDDFTAEL